MAARKFPTPISEARGALQWGMSLLFHGIALLLLVDWIGYDNAVLVALAWIATDVNRVERILWKTLGRWDNPANSED